MRTKILGLVALAALVAVLGTLGLSQKPSAQADALPIPTATAGATANTWNISGFFDEDDSCPAWGTAGCQASVTITPAANVASLVLAATGACTVDTNGNGLVSDETAGNCTVADTDPAVNSVLISTAAAAAIDVNTLNNFWRLNLTLTTTCLVNTVMTVVYTQDAGTQQAQFNCTGSSAGGVLAIGKIDQNGGFRAATFGLGVPGFATAEWTMTTTTTSTDNPCLSNDTSTSTLNPTTSNPFPNYSYSCATSPNLVNNAGILPPLGAGGFTVPVGRTIEVKEIYQPATCTLVEIKLGPSTSTTIMPLSFPVTFSFDGAAFTVNSNGVFFGTVSGTRLDLTYVNSCAIPGGATAAGSSIAVVIGGSTISLSNSTHIEIVPAPGSDDDARIDIRVRDANNTPLQGAHVTLLTDKGYISMRNDTTGTTATVGGYNVIEPSAPNFGSPFSGDTCDQGDFLNSNNPFDSSYTRAWYNGSPQAQDGYTNFDGLLSACLYVSTDVVPGITPGKATLTAIIENASPFTSSAVPFYLLSGQPGILSPQNLVLTATVTVVGPPASVRVAASPTSLQCGEKATITATITDSVGQNVSDHTRVELVSNYGSTIAGTGATLGFPGTGPVNPLSSSAAETFSGVATAFLLTSTEHVGPYEVVVTTGGSTGGVYDPRFNGILGSSRTVLGPDGQLIFAPSAVVSNQPGVFGNVGVFSTAPVSAQVTVTCSLPTIAAPAPIIPIPPIAAPRTGEGIRPPNTGDAGLADASGNSMTLVLAGAAAFVLAGIASIKFARR